MQLEFVLDNFSVAGLANSATSITNDKYGPLVTVIRRRLNDVYWLYDDKASFVDPVAWRARERNKGADHLAS